MQPAEASAVAQVVANAFGMPPVLVPWIEAALTRPGWRGYAALSDGKVVGGAALFIDGTHAWLGLGSVGSEFRQRGGQGAFMALRIADAIAAGCAQIATETGEPVADEPNLSLANMVRCGFERVASRMNYVIPTA